MKFPLYIVLDPDEDRSGTYDQRETHASFASLCNTLLSNNRSPKIAKGICLAYANLCYGYKLSEGIIVLHKGSMVREAPSIVYGLNMG